MAEHSASTARTGFIKRAWTALTSPSAKRSVLFLLVIGLVIGGGGVIATQVVVGATGTVGFCGGACHSMNAFTLPEYKQSPHFANRTGVTAGCGDCHIPHVYPYVLWYKAKAGTHDVIGEMRGVIATADQYEKERWRMANRVWDEFKETNSANCRHCHDANSMLAEKQSEPARLAHRALKRGGVTCIDCHKGVAHKAPAEPSQTENTGAK